MEQGLEAKLKVMDTKFRTEMSSGVSHMKNFEGEVENLGRNIKYAHKRIDTRAIQIKAAAKKIADLEGRCDVLTGQVGMVLFNRCTIELTCP